MAAVKMVLCCAVCFSGWEKDEKVESKCCRYIITVIISKKKDFQCRERIAVERRDGLFII